MKDHVTNLGLAYGRYGDRLFGIRLQDQLQHIVCYGQTGTGKSTLLLNMCLQNARQGVGFCLIDPHGDLADALAAHFEEQAVIWNVADPSCSYGYNPLTHTSPALRPLVTSGLIEAFRKQWADAWGVRMEHLLRHAVLALLDQAQTDMRDIMRMFLDREFRRQVVAGIQDPHVLQFWTEEYPNMNYKNAMDGVAPIANKLGTFLSHPVVRRALCEPASPLRFRQIMDEGQCLIVNLAKGKLGGDIANVVGGLIVSALTYAAFSRASGTQRRPFIAYVDEFHSFTTDALAETLSECRKYGFGLMLSQQFCLQSTSEVFASIMGNVGSLITFRVGPTDAPLLARYLEKVTPEDLINLPDHYTYMRLMVDGERTPVFSARTLPPPMKE